MTQHIQVELYGPVFIPGAVEIAQQAPVRSISKLIVYNLTTDSVYALKRALEKLHNYLSSHCQITVSASPSLPGQTISMLSSAAGHSVYLDIREPNFFAFRSPDDGGVLQVSNSGSGSGPGLLTSKSGAIAAKAVKVFNKIVKNGKNNNSKNNDVPIQISDIPAL